MSEGGVVLKNEADIAFLGRQTGGIDSLDFHCSAIGNFQTRNDPQQRRLPSAARPEQSGQFACRDIEVDVLQRHEVAESLGYASDLDTHGAPLLGRRLVMMIKAITAISARMKAAVYAVIEFTRPNC